MKIVAISGGFDPIHRGHIEYMKRAKEFANNIAKIENEDCIVVCILNSDNFLINKKGYVFQDYNEREVILEGIKYIDEVMPCIDKDQTVCKSLQLLKPNYFLKGGDRKFENIPEALICIDLDICVIDGLGNKIQSSSELVKKVKDKLEGSASNV